MSRARTGFIAAADVLSMALVTLAIVTHAAGGYRGAIFGVPVLIKSPWRVLSWAALVIAVRWIASWRQPASPDTDPPRARPFAERSTAAASGPTLRLVVLAFVALTALILLPQVMMPFGVPDLGDPLFSIWRLAWVAHQLPRDPLHLFDGNILHPHARTLAYSDAMLVPAAFAAPLLWLGVHEVLVYNIIFLASIAASGVTMFLLARELTGRPDVSFVSGILFASCAYRFTHYSHLELQVTPWMPLGLLFFHRVLVGHRRRDGLLMGLAVALQTLSSMYFGIFLTVLLACLALVFHVTGFANLRRTVVPLSSGALLAAVLVTPATIPYWQNRADVGERGREEVLYYSAVPSNYLVPGKFSVYWSKETEVAPERELFPGVVPVVLATAGLVPPLSLARCAYAVGLAVAVDGSFGLNGIVYPFLYDYVGPFRGLRVPARFGAIVALVLSILGGYGAARLTNRVERPWSRRAAIALMAVAAMVEARPLLTLQPVWMTAPRIYATLPTGKTSVLAELPLPGPEDTYGNDFTFEYFSTFHWNRIVNGASGFFPPDYLELRKIAYPFPSDIALEALAARGVEFLVVHGWLYAPSDYARVIAGLERHPSVRLVNVERWENGEIRLYRLGG